ncbi:protein of unknown function [Pseudomonas sp. JV551A1]|nr:protein of unknown function [Pseudomonas sp. JV551A1]
MIDAAEHYGEFGKGVVEGDIGLDAEEVHAGFFTDGAAL